jgi:hypothetical protein
MKKAQGTTAITKWDEQLAKMAQDSAKVVEGLAGGGSFIKTRGGLFYKDMPIPDNKMRVVVVDHVLINSFYEGKFDPEDPTIPICYAFGTNAHLMEPHSDSEKPQSKQCDGCPQNEWGTADVGRGKACKNGVRLALMVEGDLDDVATAEIAYLQLPPTSGKPWAGYVRQIAEVQHRPPLGVITEIQWLADPKTQFKIVPRYIENIEDMEILGALIEKNKKVSKEIQFPYVQIAETAKPKQQRQGRRKY